MRKFYFRTIAALALAITVSACGSKTSSNATSGGSSSAVLNAIGVAPTEDIKPDEAARFAKQATFGPTPELIDAIIAKKSIAAWLDDQFALKSSTYTDLAAKPVPYQFCSALSGTSGANCARDNFSAVPVQMRFYANAIGKDDQLRQRVAFALSQIVVASEVEVHNTAGLATFQQIFLNKSFGNYRDILAAVTLNPYMGEYLDMADSDKSQPNENYARELMQLFAVGTVLLNPDGTPQLDNTGATIPTYSNADVKEVARALTGWTYARLNGATALDDLYRDWSKPMTPYAARFDAGAKSFLGKSIPDGASQQANVDAVVDAVFNHPNTGPYIGKRLIQQLTIANPTPAYVGRVAAVFDDNGSGVRGDLKAVVRAIFLDTEARVVSQQPGKVKEPVLLATSLARTIGFQTDGWAFAVRDSAMGQAPFRAPSVFNFYPYDFPLPQSGGLVSPAGKLISQSTVLARHNFVFDWTIHGDASRIEFQKQAEVSYATGTVPNWASWEAYGPDDGKILDRINLVMLNGTMTPTQRQSLLAAMAPVKDNSPTAQTRRRAQAALYIVASSPLFQVDR